MSNKEETSTLTESKEPTKDGKKRRGKGAVGKTKIQNRLKFGERHRAEQFEKRAAATALADQFLATLNQLESQKTKPAAELPITTRGFGLMVAKCYQTATNKQPAPNMTVFEMYRATLGQMEAQLRFSKHHQLPSVPPFIDAADISMYQGFEPDLRTYNRNFAPLCAMLDSLGTFQIDAHTFNPVIPKSQLQIVLIGEDTLEVDGVAPDPYLVTLSNLRDTVVFLSNGNTPVQYRKYFHERNPLPGARWTNQHRLLNPDQIIPPGYSNADLLNDLRKLRDYADTFKDKVLYAQGVAHIDGKGSAAQLVSGTCYHRNFTTPTRLEVTRYVAHLEDHFSVRSLQSNDWFIGTTALYGEIQDEFAISDTIALPRKAFDSRSNNGAVERFTGEWVTTSDAFFSKGA